MNIPPLTIEPALKAKCPHLQLGCFAARVVVRPTGDALKGFIDQEMETLAQQFEIEEISSRSKIQATRLAYKALGKKPGRYRPSAEALLRRVVSGKGLYQISNVIDLLNTISLQTGYSIGGYDLDQIQGAVRLGIGEPGEPYQAIARGALNIANLPVFRDALGAFGSPTSDSVRTSITDDTTSFLMVLFDFEPDGSLAQQMEEVAQLFARYCAATDATIASYAA
jgi:DNA/RNA-binding domain of Phe-tRNA-synthetase-like protein